ncbi:polysaccharide synthesis protein GtrA [Erwinia sp. OLTSP20]|uniref:GtrA family protein n=1 Tax=unclassified Erwinia TaxID=2622719 RepID=UPI000C18D493|nr:MULTISPECIES: GtrA family protein [unclassified Erwinia]PIJ50898.1 polysaccharide synthesis protein GtrA [Erwinia sp. OAMSP11]PIJ73282.1 polysaccharide synthesis protein GtrA [Erwinia sp. OLSSP12]PIJ82296.1 polysaccharide synthesis protein GtrA [Erwinia sp. OLCASP19]PIJ85448.1 polysaccharide synthesis protein GtrA [Erwinia sp. OLMTSP26]PIJ87145.1 polysaccharide synthesis protein GtrA [Erwinia sp. OLMDSP33]
MKKLLTETFKFAITGVIGFMVDTLVLYLLKGLTGLYGARLISFSCAVITTWLINRSLTFAATPSQHGKHKEFATYFLIMCVGGAVNLACYSGLIAVSPLTRHYPVLAIAAGSLIGMFFNFSLSKALLYHGKAGKSG